MSLYRLIYAEACQVCGLAQGCVCAHSPYHLRRKGPMRRTIAHGSEGPCPRKAGATTCRCPEVEGEILEVWVDAKTALEALEKGIALHPNTHAIRAERGLRDKTLDTWKTHLVGRRHQA